jgi:hypothetical protein
MYPSLPPAAPSGGSARPERPVKQAQPDRPVTPGQPGQKPPARRSSKRGLWIIIAVLVCAAAAAAVVCLWWVPWRESTSVTAYGSTGDPDAAARTLVRNAMTAIESAYVDLGTFDPATVTQEVLESIEPSMTFIAMADNTAATSPSAVAENSEVNYFGGVAIYAVGTVAPSGKVFGAIVDKALGGRIIYYVDGTVVQDWGGGFDTAGGSSTTGTPISSVGTDTVAADAAAKSLVRNAMAAIDSAFVDLRTFDPAIMIPAVLQSIELSITFIAAAGTVAATAPTAWAAVNAVSYSGTVTAYAVGTVSASGKTFGVIVDKGAGGGNAFYINGATQDW